MGIFDSFFSDPAKAAQPYYNQVAPTITPYYQPYVNAGNQALPQLQSQYQQLMSDPSAIINRLGAGYKPSEGYQFQLGEGEKAINNAQAAGGMLGTPQHQQLAGQLAEKLASGDYETFLNHVLGLYGSGLSGTQGIMQQGYGASNDLASSLASALMNQGNLAYSGVQGQNNLTGGIINDIFGLGSAYLNPTSLLYKNAAVR